MKGIKIKFEKKNDERVENESPSKPNSNQNVKKFIKSRITKK